jgi:protein SCO1/2
MRSVGPALLAAGVLLLAGCGGEAATGGGAATNAGETGDALAGTPMDGRPAPDFTLADEEGDQVTLSDLRGEPVLLTFIYTHCPDVCPLIAQNLDRAANAVPGTQVVAVSVDATGDTPAAVREFRAAHRLGPEFRYLIGSAGDLARVWRDYAVYAAAAGGNLVDHSALTMLIDPDGKQRAAYPPQFAPDDVVHDLRQVTDS